LHQLEAATDERLIDAIVKDCSDLLRDCKMQKNAYLTVKPVQKYLWRKCNRKT